jgi:hypothetical protein
MTTSFSVVVADDPTLTPRVSALALRIGVPHHKSSSAIRRWTVE